MARLNEPPAASALVLPQAETVDALKRRFIRQNRELAKNNSTQSLRIRHLEIEVGRLLTDNLDLREQVLRQQVELERVNTEIPVSAVEKVRDELKAKLLELGDLVAGLDGAVRDAQPAQMTRGRGMVQGQWRERQPLIEAMRDSQMPTITEDKLYPRRTLDVDEMHNMRLSDHNSNGSPDIGSPPVARFDLQRPDELFASVAVENIESYDEEADPVKLSANLETRRSRKKDTTKIQIRRGSLLSQSPTKADPETTAQILRAGAKRKLADRDLERKHNKHSSSEDFVFTRRAAKPDGQVEPADSLVEIGISENAGTDAELPSYELPERKILGDKSTNISPRKVNFASKPEKDNSGIAKKGGNDGTRRQSRARRVSAIPLPSSPEHVVPTVEATSDTDLAAVELHLTTPAASEDLFSPTSSARSVGPNSNRDTPPPADLTSVRPTTGDVRPSRRARSAVNYAEPSLVAKMRRPGKELADAISGLQDPRLAMRCTTSSKSTAPHRTIQVKKEQFDDDNDHDWKGLTLAAATGSLSPLQSANAKTSCSGVSNRAKEMMSPFPPTNELACDVSLSTKNVVKGNTLQPDTTDPVPATKHGEDLAIYEFTGSSSPATIPKSSTAKPSQRRQSSAGKKLEVAIKQEESKDALSKPVARSERAASRRKSMML